MKKPFNVTERLNKKLAFFEREKFNFLAIRGLKKNSTMKDLKRHFDSYKHLNLVDLSLWSVLWGVYDEKLLFGKLKPLTTWTLPRNLSKKKILSVVSYVIGRLRPKKARKFYVRGRKE